MNWTIYWSDFLPICLFTIYMNVPRFFYNVRWTLSGHDKNEKIKCLEDDLVLE